VKEDEFASIGSRVAGIDKFLDSLGIRRDTRFVVLPDHTMNGGLYFINRPGWIIYDSSHTSIMNLRKYISAGAAFIGCNRFLIQQVCVWCHSHRGFQPMPDLQGCCWFVNPVEFQLILVHQKIDVVLAQTSKFAS
jgi:hypothetical protein